MIIAFYRQSLRSGRAVQNDISILKQVELHRFRGRYFLVKQVKGYIALLTKTFEEI